MMPGVDALFSNPGPLREQVSAHVQAQRWDQAWEGLQVLAVLAPLDAWGWQWRVVVAMALGKSPEAVEAARTALTLIPAEQAQARADVLFNMGQALGLLGQPAQALQAFDEALGLGGEHLGALVGRAKALAALGRHGQAGEAASRALAMEPRHKEALSLVANSLVMAGAHEQAVKAFMQYEQTYPASPFMACMVVYLMRQLADWRWPKLPVNAAEGSVLMQAEKQKQSPELQLLAHRARKGLPALEPFASLVMYDDPALHRLAAQQMLSHLHPASGEVPRPAPAAGRVLRVAYVSCEFNEHATGYLLAGVLARHNPQRVQVYLLSFAPPNKGAKKAGEPDAMEQRFKRMGHTWVDVHGWSDAQVAQWCREQQMDVAVDLKGLTRDHRIGIFAHRAAPVQVNWLGYPGTLPAPYFDWVLADAQVLPPGQEEHFAERIWRLPHCYQPNDPDRPIDPTPQTRAEHGLPESGVVLVCFNNHSKFTPQVWGVWMRLLQARADAVLWLLAGSARVQENLRDHARSHGVNPDRLVFAPALPQARHLARLALADLSLDTLPCNAHTTASDALWAGVPHVACTGQSFASRVGASLLTAVGLPQLIGQGIAHYEKLLKRLLLDDGVRKQVRDWLALRRKDAPLWDAAAFARALEQAYAAMVDEAARQPE